MYEYNMDRIASYTLENIWGGRLHQQIGESHSLFGPASEILWDRASGTRAVEWECEIEECGAPIAISIYLKPKDWCNTVREAPDTSEYLGTKRRYRVKDASRNFVSHHEAELWLSATRLERPEP